MDESLDPQSYEEAVLLQEAFGIPTPIFSSQDVKAIQVASVLYPERYRKEVMALGESHEELRTRLERIEQAAKDALDIWQQTQIAGSHGIPLCDAMIGLRAALENADG